MSRLAAVMLVLLCAACARGQTIYQPIQYQFGSNPTFYYGGTDPSVLPRALQATCDTALPQEPVQVFADCIPYWNAAIFGYTADDARNDAYQNVPRYFRKGDLLTWSVPGGDGTRLVPWNAPGEARAPVRPGAAVAKAPPSGAPAGRSIIIFPKRPSHPAVPPDQRMTSLAPSSHADLIVGSPPR